MCLPGLALVYAGLLRAKNMLSLFTQCFGGTGVVGVLWGIYGYSRVVGKPTGLLAKATVPVPHGALKRSGPG